ncbi:antitoxin Xre-like helix-turn-helix domain-containing protein [Kiloniella litopenaei]|uniref:antitoxin Xre-like helix-turn-helix domain-containing protein n=1 Tax=Kiloniella litopenaei TaxID=1549748 RepID=UPI003BABC801
MRERVDRTECTQEELHAMQRAIINMFKKWKINNSQAVILLGGISVSTFQRWKQGRYGRIGPDLAARMSNLLGIHKALRLLFSDPTRGYGWIKLQSRIFEASALEVMLRGQLTDLMRVRRYLDSQRRL